MSGTDEFTTTPNLGLKKPNYDADAELWGLHLNENADVLDAAISPAGCVFLPLSGGQMTGGLALATNPANPLDAATKSYVDSTVSGAVGITETPADGTPYARRDHGWHPALSIVGGILMMPGLPTSPNGLPKDAVWNNGGTLCIAL